ncbi:S-adenosylmethionine mitochondrial carrier protein [Talaromyces pinophilus]|nr:S-adenosylmethionine mitochondrial carrier protein [Talaromyces pinophilus]
MYNTNTDIWLAGAIAAFTVDFVVYPLDTLKTRIQSPRYKELYTDAATGAVQRRLLFRGLYQGIWSVVMATIPSSGAFFTTYEGIKHILNSSTTKHSSNDSTTTPTSNLLPFKHPLPTPVINGLASSAAECVSCFILTPAEVLKQNAQMVTTSTNRKQQSSKKNPTMQVLATFRAHPTHLWRGYGTLVARNLPFTAMQFPLFEYLREWIQHKWQRRRQQRRQEEQSVSERALITALSAGVAGGVAAIITTPIDVVKTRVMLAAAEEGEQRKPADLACSSSRSRGAFAVGKEIYIKEGMRGLFKGGSLRSVWTALGLGLYLSAYETGRMYFEKRREGKDREDP